MSSDIKIYTISFRDKGSEVINYGVLDPTGFCDGLYCSDGRSKLHPTKVAVEVCVWKSATACRLPLNADSFIFVFGCFSERPVKLFSIQERSPALSRDLLSAHTTADKLGKGQH